MRGHRCPQQRTSRDPRMPEDRHVPDPGRSLRPAPTGGPTNPEWFGPDVIRGSSRPYNQSGDQGHLPAMVQIHRLQDGPWPWVGGLPRPGALEGELRHPERQDRAPQRHVAQSGPMPSSPSAPRRRRCARLLAEIGSEPTAEDEMEGKEIIINEIPGSQQSQASPAKSRALDAMRARALNRSPWIRAGGGT